MMQADGFGKKTRSMLVEQTIAHYSAALAHEITAVYNDTPYPRNWSIPEFLFRYDRGHERRGPS